MHINYEHFLQNVHGVGSIANKTALLQSRVFLWRGYEPMTWEDALSRDAGLTKETTRDHGKPKRIRIPHLHRCARPPANSEIFGGIAVRRKDKSQRFQQRSYTDQRKLFVRAQTLFFGRFRPFLVLRLIVSHVISMVWRNIKLLSYYVDWLPPKKYLYTFSGNKVKVDTCIGA